MDNVRLVWTTRLKQLEPAQALPPEMESQALELEEVMDILDMLRETMDSVDMAQPTVNTMTLQPFSWQ